jgi:hypothetical protein
LVPTARIHEGYIGQRGKKKKKKKKTKPNLVGNYERSFHASLPYLDQHD